MQWKTALRFLNLSPFDGRFEYSPADVPAFAGPYAVNCSDETAHMSKFSPVGDSGCFHGRTHFADWSRERYP